MVRDSLLCIFFFFQAEDGIRDHCVTGVQTCCSSDLGPCRRAARRGAARARARRPARPPARARWPGRPPRSEERRVGKEWRPRWGAYDRKNKTISYSILIWNKAVAIIFGIMKYDIMVV